MKIIFPLLFVAAFLFSACSVNKLVTDANNSFSNKEYFIAAEKYRQVNAKLKDKTQKSSVYFRMAESYRQLGDYAKAAVWYKNAVRAGYRDSLLNLRLADALRGAGRPEEAKPIYAAEQKKAPTTTSQWAANGLESIRQIQEWKGTPELYLIENLKTVNSAATDVVTQILSEKAPAISLSSSRTELTEKKINPATGQKYADILTSVFDSTKQKWTIPAAISDPVSVNSPNEELALVTNHSQTLVIVARQISRPAKPSQIQLFYLLKKDGQWSAATPLPFISGDADYTDPMISEDGKTLWFASDKAGGAGGFDIWKSEIDAQENLAEPVNAGKEINTPGDERWPFQKPNGQLYFSSDFHPGMGGFDLFQAQKVNSDQWQIAPLPPPVNSPGNDLSIRFSGNREKGFFSSNRKGSRGMDVYSFQLPPKLFQCFGKIHDSETDSILPDVNIRIVGSDGSSQKIRAVKGQFEVALNPETDYAIVVFANGYLNAQAKVSTRGLRQAKEFGLDIRPVPTNKPIRIDNITYEFSKADLTPEAKSALEKLVDLLKVNPEAVIEISSHTDDKGDEQFNLELSESRAASVVRYLTGKGIPAQKLKAKGYGESSPAKVKSKLAAQFSFLQENMALSPENIDQLSSENQKETARELNRRTEFKVIQAGSMQYSK